jgi:hypothetical protein
MRQRLDLILERADRIETRRQIVVQLRQDASGLLHFHCQRVDCSLRASDRARPQDLQRAAETTEHSHLECPKDCGKSKFIISGVRAVPVRG